MDSLRFGGYQLQQIQEKMTEAYSMLVDALKEIENDLHLKGFEKLGAKIIEDGNHFIIYADELKGKIESEKFSTNNPL